MRYEDVKKGQTVKITKSVVGYKEDPDGRVWDNGWAQSMDGCIGREFTVDAIGGRGVMMKEDRRYSWPWESLELVEAETEVETEAAIEVGDIVKITSQLGIYATYAKMAKVMGLDRFCKGLYPGGCHIINTECERYDSTYKVLSVKKHLDYVDIVVGIEDLKTGDQFIHNVEKLALHKKSKMSETTDERENEVMSEQLFETRNYINGTETKNMTNSDIIQVIKNTEAKIADLKAVKTKSSAIANEVSSLQDGLARIVEELDSRE